MKLSINVLLSIIVINTLYASNSFDDHYSDGFNYQAVIRDNNGEILASTNVTVRFSILNAGQQIWQETQTTTTNAFGMINLVIGAGNSADGTTLQDLDWSEDFSIEVQVDSGEGFASAGSAEMQSVPYAFYAQNGLSSAQATKLANLDESAEENVQANWNESDEMADAFIANKPNIPNDISELSDDKGLLAGNNFDGSFNSLSDVPEGLDLDTSDDFSGDYNDLANKPTIPSDINQLSDTGGLLNGTTFDGSYSSLTDVPENIDTDATDDFSGSFGDLTDLPENLDTDATDDFSGDYNDLANRPAIPSDINELTDNDGLLSASTFDGSYTSLTDIPENLDTDATDDFSGSYNDLTDLPANLDTDSSDDFDGSYNSLTDIPANLDTNASDDFSGNYEDLNNIPDLPYRDIGGSYPIDFTELTLLYAPGIKSSGSGVIEYYLPDHQGLAGMFMKAGGTGGATSWDYISFDELTNVPASLDTDVSDDFSGNYEDLDNKPGIPSDINELTDTDGLLNPSFDGSFLNLTDIPANLDLDNTDDFSGSFNDLADVPSDLADGDDVADADADPGNEIQSLILDFEMEGLYLSGSDAEPVPLSAIAGEDQDLRFTSGVISLSSDPDNTQIDLSAYDDNASDDFSGDYNDLLNQPAIISSLSTHSASELSDITDVGSGQIISDDERTVLDSWEGSSASEISSTDIDNWNDAHGWGDHGAYDYAVETDFVDLTSVQGIAGADITSWSAAATNVSTNSSSWDAAASTVSSKSANWDEAFGWGDHSTAGYATTGSFTDLVTVQGIESSDLAAWDAAATNIAANSSSWDDAASTVADNSNDWDAAANAYAANGSNWESASTSVLANSANWDEAHNWGDHSTAGYLTSADQVVTKTGNLIQTGDTDDDFLYGSTQLDNIDGIGTDDGRIFFDKSKGAFRAGVASGDQWDEANIGDFSVAVGGAGNTASGLQSAVVGGLFNTATAERAISAGGYLNNATGDYSNVYGGLFNNATNNRSSVLGGESNTASGGFATVNGGFKNTASGSFASASGIHNTAGAYGETVIGHYATVLAGQNAGGVTYTDRLFAIGNGLDNDSRSNALEVNKQGDMKIAGGLKVGDTGDADVSAALEVNSTSQGFLPPRLTTAQRDAIVDPAPGLTIFNTETVSLEFFTGYIWFSMGGCTPLALAPGSVTAVAKKNLEAEVSFTPTGGETSFTVVSAPGGITATGSSSPIVVTGLAAGVDYTFSVNSSTDCGDSPTATSNSIIAFCALPPSNINVSTNLSVATISFEPSGAESSFTAVSNPDGITVSGSSSPLVISGLTLDTEYTFDLYATETCGNSAIGTSPAVTPCDEVAQDPTNVVATLGQDGRSVTVSFTPANGETSFIVSSQDGVFSQNASASPVTFTDLDGGVDYSFSVTAIDECGNSNPVASNTVQTYFTAVFSGYTYTLSNQVATNKTGPIIDGSYSTSISGQVITAENEGLNDNSTSLGYCAQLSDMGHDDWFLPSVSEMQSMFNNNKVQSYIDLMPSSTLWTAARFQTHPSFANYYYVYLIGSSGGVEFFQYGSNTSTSNSSQLGAVCMRRE